MAQKAICPNCYKTNLYEYEKPHVCGYCAKSFVSAFSAPPTTPILPPTQAAASKTKRPGIRVKPVEVEPETEETEEYDENEHIDVSKGITKYHLNLDDPTRKTTVKDLMGQGGGMAGQRQLRSGASFEKSQAEIQKMRSEMRQGNNAPVYVIGDLNDKS